MASSSPEITIASPKLVRLIQDLKSDDSAIENFWIEAEEQGTPIFEEFDPESETWLVTFVYRETEPLNNVLLVEWIRDGDFPDKGMTFLEGTDIWYTSLRLRDGLRSQYGFGPNDSLVAKREEQDWETRRASWTIDPLNKTPLVRKDARNLERIRGEYDSVLAMPNAPQQTWIERSKNATRGDLIEQRFSSDSLGNERDIWLYVHPEIDRSLPVPLLVAFDGENFDEVLRTPCVLDNLISDGKIEPMAAIFVGNVDRGEELPCNANFVSMLKHELLPYVEKELNIEFSARKTVVNGVSYGGLAAMYAGLTEPDTFGLVASQSGSFWWKPDPMDTTDILGETDSFSWLPEQAVTIPSSDIRIWMESGTLEGRGFMGVAPSLLYSNRHMRDVLRARGFEVEYSEYIGGHDYAHWRNSLGDALVHLFGERG